MREIRIAGTRIGPGRACFIIAEAGVNHNGDLKKAKKLILAAKASGADAVKFQTFRAEHVVGKNAPKAEYQIKAGVRDSHYAMLKRLELSEEEHRVLKNYAKKNKIIFLSTPFDFESADLLQSLKVPAFKISSGEITNSPFLDYVARKKKPMIVSTGMSNLKEVEQAVRTIKSAGNKNFVLLHCVTQYPASPQQVNLKAIQTMRSIFNCPVGYSDHTPGIEISIAAVAMGACVIEKHLTLNKNLKGPDHRASLEPDEFALMVKSIRSIESAFGNGKKQAASSEKENILISRRSLHWRRNMRIDEKIKSDDLIALRPGTGIAPGKLSTVIGKKIIRSVSAGQKVMRKDFER